MGESNGNGNTVRLNTTILVWLGGLTLLGVLNFGISLERLNTVKDQQGVLDIKYQQLEIQYKAFELLFSKTKINIELPEEDKIPTMVKKGKK